MMNLAINDNVVFKALKPICDDILLNVSEQTVNELNNLLLNLPPKSIQKCQSYICFPIELQLMRLSSAHQKQLLISTLTKVLSLSTVDSVNMLQRLSNLLFQQVSIGKVQISAGEVPEELKLSVVECFTQLWQSATSDILYDLYTREFYPRLSPMVYMLVQLAKNEKLIKLRVAALECLQVLCFVRDSAFSDDAELRQRARNVIMLMLPGIVSCCATIAAEPITQNHKITVANLELWSRVVCLVMEDREPAEEQVSASACTASATTPAEKVEQMQRLRRTGDWLRDTADRLVVVTEAQLRSQTHSHWQVRCQLAKAAHDLLTTCARNMAPSVGSLVCCLIVLSEDEMIDVRDPACQALAEFSREFEHDTGQPLLELVESAFYSLLSRIPRIMQGTDEGSQMTSLSLLSGYLRLQGRKLPHVLSSGPFLQRLLLALLLTAQLDCSHISLLEDCSIREVESDQVLTEPWKKLLYCNTIQKSRKLQDICCVLWKSADLHVITHALLDMLDSNPEYSKEIVFLLNHILAGDGADSMKDQAELIRTVVSVYLQPRLWDVPFSVNQRDSAAITISRAQSNIVQVSLLAEGLGLFALSVGGKSFSLCLLRCLYPLLECAGSALHPLATAGLSAVQNVAKACVEGGVTELVQANVDYLSHHITTRLKRAHHNPGVLSVLSVVMRHTTVQVLPCLHEIIEDVLVQSCDVFQEFNANGFLRVFLTFLVCLRGWQTEEAKVEEMFQPKKSILDELLEYKRCIQTAEDLDNEELIDEEINEQMFTNNEDRNEVTEVEEDLEDKPKTVPSSIKLTVTVLERSLHFLPSKYEHRQILVLDILKEGVLVLKQEEDQLLPIVHKMWSPLVNRFQSSISRPLVMHRAFLLLCTLGSTAREFIRSRTLKQVLGPLCQELQDLASHSTLKGVGSAYRLTQQFKLQRALLGGMGRLALDLSLQERDLQQILTATTSYLSSRQPAPLQELCQRLYTELATMHPDLVWLHLISIWSSQAQLVPPSTTFPTFKLDTCTDDTSEFKKNVSQLLNSISS